MKLGESVAFAQGYADDIFILVSGIFTVSICDIMQNVLNIGQDWFEEKVFEPIQSKKRLH